MTEAGWPCFGRSCVDHELPCHCLTVATRSRHSQDLVPFAAGKQCLSAPGCDESAATHPSGTASAVSSCLFRHCSPAEAVARIRNLVCRRRGGVACPCCSATWAWRPFCAVRVAHAGNRPAHSTATPPHWRTAQPALRQLPTRRPASDRRHPPAHRRHIRPTTASCHLRRRR